MSEAKINLEQALEETGFILCNFKSDGGDCDCCNKVIKKGGDVYYLRTSFECEEGVYFCAKCVIKRAEDNASQVTYKCPTCGGLTLKFQGQPDTECFDCFANKEWGK